MTLFSHLAGWQQLLLFWVSNQLEIFATLCGLIYIIFSVKGNKLLWIFGLITSALYVYVFFDVGIYADMGINLYYVAVSVYGWIHWSHKKEQPDLLISRISWREGVISLFVITFIYFVIDFVLVYFTDSDVAHLDAFTTSASIVATWMLARKILEQWIIWIVVDAVSVGLYIYKGLMPTVILFLVYTILACAGYFQWLKQWRQQQIALSS